MKNDAADIVNLTVKEREALALVAKHLSTKEIARKLGVSPSAIDQRIDSARAKLGGVRRTTAARIFLELLDQDLSCEKTTGQSFTVSESELSRDQAMDDLNESVFRFGDVAQYGVDPSWGDWRERIIPELDPAKLSFRSRLNLIVWGAVGVAVLFAILAGLITVINALV